MREMTPRDRASKGFSLALQRLAHGTAKTIAQEMGVSDSAVSELKTRQLEPCLLLLAHLGLKVVDADARYLDPVAFEFLTATHARLVRIAPDMVWQETQS